MPEPFVILCVDDDANNTEMFARVLKDNYVVLTANSAREGLKVFGERKVHAIISDQRMPEMNGMEFLHEIRKTDEKVIFVILTAYGELNMAIEALNKDKIQGYFQKPVQVDELVAFLKHEWRRQVLKEEHERLLKQTTELHAELKNLNQLKSDFLRFLAHEIRTPLATVATCLELVNPGELPTRLEDYSTFWNLAQNSNETLRRLLENMLFLLEIEHMGFQVKFESVSVRSALSTAVSKLKIERTAKALSINDAYLEDVFVQGDAEGLCRVLGSLLDNAIEYSDPGGKVNVGARQAGKMVKLWIASKGSGVYPEFSEKVFQILPKQGHSDGRTPIGAGINLAIARRIITVHGGTIGLEKEPDGQITIFMEMPVASGKPSDAGDFLIL